MTDKVDYGDLLPHEFQQRLQRRPVGYLPLGTLEWHGEHNALGADYFQSQALFRRAAHEFGGIVFPPLWLGPDRITAAQQPHDLLRQAQDDRVVAERVEGDRTVSERPFWPAPDLIGMDTADVTTPHRQLSGSCYWIPKGLFLMLVESILAQARRAGFRCIVADGHGPSRNAFAEMADTWEKQFGLKLVSAARDFPGRWRTQMDHAARNETSILMAVAPELVDLSRLPAERKVWPQGVGGEDPRDATPAYGEELLSATLALIGARLDELGI